MKRYLYLWHRWLGIVACLFMALWFISGVVMLYVGYPKLTPVEHLAHLPVLQLEPAPADLFSAALYTGAVLLSLVLVSLLYAVFRMLTHRGRPTRG